VDEDNTMTITAQQLRVPPGPKGHFLLGSLPQMAQNPPEFLRRLTDQYEDIAHFRMAAFDTYLITNPDLIHEVLVSQRDQFVKSTFDKLILSKFLGNGLILSDGDYHRRQRRLVQPAFHTRRIESYAATMTEYTLRLLDSWQPGETRDIHTDMMQITMEIVSKTLFDSEVGGAGIIAGRAIEELQEISNVEFRTALALPEWLPIPRSRRRRNARVALDSVVLRFIEERRQNPQDRGDLLSMLLLSADEDGQRMTDREVRDEAVNLFAAGHETTSNALTWTWYALAQNPDIEARLHEELDSVSAGRTPTLADLPSLPYTEMVIKESLRLYPPVWALNARLTLADVNLGGYRIPRKSRVFISPYALHRSARFFADPLRFDPERFLPENEARIPRYAYFPFGGGPRICIGSSFALLEARLILAAIAGRWRLTLAPGHDVEPEALITLRPKHGLRMQLHPRTAPSVT
jgi:cytochrome P450